MGTPKKEAVISGEILALTAACCNSMNCRVGDKDALLIAERLFTAIPGVGIVPEGNWEFGPGEGVITLSRVVLKGPWILEPSKPELEVPEAKLGRTGRTVVVLGIAGVKPPSPPRLFGAWASVGATMLRIKMRARTNAAGRFQIICMTLSPKNRNNEKRFGLMGR